MHTYLRDAFRIPNSFIRNRARDGGLAKFDDTKWDVYSYSNSGLPNNLVRSIAIDSYGNKWIGTDGGVLAKFDDTNWTVYDTSNSVLPYNIISSIAIDDYGNKWIGTSDGLAVFNEGGIIAIKDNKPSVSIAPLKLSLHRHSPITRISYSLLKPSHVVLKVFDIKGRCLKDLVNNYKKAGNYSTTIDCGNLSNGTYFVYLRIGEKSVIEKMVILK